MFRHFRKIGLTPRKIIFVLIFLQILLAFLTNYSGLTFDEAIWHYIGRNWFRHGLIPYKGGVDNKSPLLYMIYGLSDLLFGINYWFPRLVAIASQSIGIYFVYRIAKHVADKQTGIIAIILYGLSLLWRSTDGKMVSLPQAYEITFLILSFYYYLTAKQRKNIFISGIMAGIALGFKFTAGVPLLILFVSILHKKSLSEALIYLSGILTVLGLLIILFLVLGINLHDFIIYSFSDNFAPGSITSYTFTWKLEQFSNAFFFSEMILFYPFIITYILVQRKFDIFILWATAAFISIAIIGMFARSHMKELLPPLSIMSALSVNYLITKHQVSFKKIVIILSLTFFPKTFEPFFAFQRILASLKTQNEPMKNSDDDLKKLLGLWIKSHTTDNEKIYIAGYSSEAQVYSTRLSPSIYFNVTQTPLAKKRLYSDLTADKPAVIAVPNSQMYLNTVDADMRLFISELVMKQYTLDTCIYGFNVYRYSKID